MTWRRRGSTAQGRPAAIAMGSATCKEGVKGGRERGRERGREGIEVKESEKEVKEGGGNGGEGGEVV